MSVATPAASRLLCRSLAANSAKTSSRAVAASSSRSTASSISTSQQHQFHTTSPTLSRKRRSPYRNVKAEKLGLLDPEKRPGVVAKYQNLISPDYDDTDVETLQKKYTPEQIEALVMGENVVLAEDLVEQGRMRNDPYRPQYLEDFATLRPVIDRREKTGRPVDTSARFMTPDEFEDDFLEWIRERDVKNGKKEGLIDMGEALAMYEEMRSKMLSKQEGEELTSRDMAEAVDRVMGPAMTAEELSEMTRDGPEKSNSKGMREKSKEDEMDEKVPDDTMAIYKYLTERNSMTGFDGGDSALAPELPKKVPGVAGLYRQETDDDDATLDPEGIYQELRKKTGMNTKQIIDLAQNQTKILVRRFVSNQTRLGKIRSTYVLAICGNKNGRLGLGEAKSVDPETATSKAKLAAIRNMQPIRRYEQRTIYGNVEAKVGGTIVQLYARPPGFGLRVSHRFFEMARAVGLQDLAAKMPRSRNPMNSVKACFQALMNQPDPETIALGRGKKLVDARKVYYGGATL
ncbi:28S ribosomal protein S5, mitochondrial [Gnomoniopsis sp. IMI 355080]|nr:28S ribosomal protein S5, mitochondrial [Gnomoniopsis sp. IMI 355080]